MDTKVKGIVLKLIDYKDADKLASIFTLTEGVITAKFTGVKRDKAKMKAVAQPFTFAEFNINQKGSLRTITSADIIDNFNLILSDYNKTICGYIVLDMIKSILPEQKREEDIFIHTITALKNIETENEFIATIDFILKFIALSGMELEFFDSKYNYFDVITGNFESKNGQNKKEIDKNVYALLKSINDGQPIESNEITQKRALKFLHNVLYIKFGEDIKSFMYI
ncbi:MAG: DNA repair protein RecO [Clostridia bacterium]|nr:DNA repair protein RecO [Clostridia bacterium]